MSKKKQAVIYSILAVIPLGIPIGIVVYVVVNRKELATKIKNKFN